MDTGLIGLVAFAGALIAVLLSGLRQLLLRPTIPTSFFYLVFVLMAVRGFTDVIIGPMNVHMVLFCAACAYAFWTPETDHATSPNFNWGRLRPARIPESG